MTRRPHGWDFLVVRMNHSNAGFFAQVQFAINQIRFANDHGLTPVVFYGQDSIDGPNAFYEEAAGPNVWEYYFEPVGGVTLDLAREQARRSGRRLLTLGYWELWRLHNDEPRSVFTYPYGHYRHVVDKSTGLDGRWWARQRSKGRRLVRANVQVRPEILAKVDRFAGEHFKGPVLGVHARGTDKHDTGTGSRVARIVPPAEYFPLIDDYLSRHAGARVFFATDQKQFRDEMTDRYGDRLISYAAILSESDVNVFQQQRASGRGNRDKGEEVLIDALLLSRCDFLLKCTSAVGEFAMYFSDSLECVDMNFVGWPEAERRSALRRAATAAREAGLAARFAARNRRRDRQPLEDADDPTVPDEVLDTNRLVLGQ